MLEKLFQNFAEAFENINRINLAKYFEGTVQLKKPGILICFDDGYRNNHDVAVPLFDKYDLTGLFFVIAGACDPEPCILNRTFNTMFCMSWDHLQNLRERGHEIGCHSYSHLFSMDDSQYEK